MSADHIFTKPLVSLYLQVQQRDPRDILGLYDGEATPTAAEARAAYRALALRLHPDKCQSASTEELHTRLFQRVQEAYELIISATSVDNKDPTVATGDDVKVQLPEVDDLTFMERLRRKRDAQVAEAQARKTALAEKRFRHEAKVARLADLYKYKNQVATAKEELEQKKRALSDSRRAAVRYGKDSKQYMEALHRLEHYTALREERIAAGTDDTYEKRENTDELRRVSDQKREEFVKKHRFLHPSAYAAIDKFRRIEFHNNKNSKAITGDAPQLTRQQKQIKKGTEKNAVKKYKTQTRITSRKQRGGDAIFDRPEELDQDLAPYGRYHIDKYEASLIKGRVTNLSLCHQEYKERLEAKKIQRTAELETAIKKYATATQAPTYKDQSLMQDPQGNPIVDEYKVGHGLGINYLQKQVEIEERPLAEEDVEVWESNAKYIFDFSRGSELKARLNPDWIHAEKDIGSISNVHRDTIEEWRDDVVETAEDPVLPLEDTASQLDISDEAAWPHLPSSTAVVEAEAFDGTMREEHSKTLRSASVRGPSNIPLVGNLLKIFTEWQPYPLFLREGTSKIADGEEANVD